MFEVRIERDTVANGVRLTTFVCTYPRFIHAQLMTHRVFSRNAQSSRAVPTAKLIKQVEENPVEPVFWGQNQSGMEAEEELPANLVLLARAEWRSLAKEAASSAKVLMRYGAHKQIVNRLLEPFTTITALISATEWENFFKLRLHHAAQPEMQKLAQMMKGCMDRSEPRPAGEGPVKGWHTPFIRDDDPALSLPQREVLLVSAARCARVSYLNHEGQLDLQKDLGLADRLVTEGHWSPFEHVARPATGHEDDPSWDEPLTKNFYGWVQLRRLLEIEQGCPGLSRCDNLART